MPKEVHGGTNIAPNTYSAAVPVEKIETALPHVETEGGTSRSAMSSITWPYKCVSLAASHGTQCSQSLRSTDAR